MHTRKLGHKVAPRSMGSIWDFAQRVRDALSLSGYNFNIAALYEVLQEEGVLEFEVVPDNNFSEDALTYPDQNRIVLKESVYNGAADGIGHYRFTLAHELGHLFLHRNQKPTAYARGERPNHKIYEDSEWQADEFAAELLMDSRKVDVNLSTHEAAIKYGMSPMAAGYKLKKIKKTARMRPS